MKKFNSYEAQRKKKGLDQCNLGVKFLNTPRSYIDFFEEIKKSSRDGSEVLDAGAGEGNHARIFNGVKVNYTGIDSGVGHREWDYSNVKHGDIENLNEYPNAFFDIILLVQVLEHVKEPSSVLSELNRVAKENTKLFIAVPQSQAVHQVPNDFYRYTPYGLVYLLEKNNWSVEKIDPQIYGDFEANVRRLQWTLDEYRSRSDLKPFEKFLVKTVFFVSRLVKRAARLLDRKSIRNVNPIGYFVVAQKK